MSYYDNQTSGQWPPAPSNSNPQQPAQASGWEHQTPPARSGANSAIPRDEHPAFVYQLEEVDRAIDNLMKSGKMFNMGGRFGRSAPPPGVTRPFSGDGGPDARQHPSSSNLQNYYASQRHQSSRGSNDTESMIQAKRRMAAARERDLRNYHQEQQYNRTVVPDVPGQSGKAGRNKSPSVMSENDRREVIALQRSAFYGEGPFIEKGSCIGETGAMRSGPPTAGAPGTPGAPGPSNLRRPSPLMYDFSRGTHAEATPSNNEQSLPTSSAQPPRDHGNSSPHSNAPSNKGFFEGTHVAQQSSRTSSSSPSGSPHQGAPIGSKPTQPSNSVAPIGTRPGVTSASVAQTVGNNMSTPPLTSPLRCISGTGEETTSVGISGSSNSPSTSGDGSSGLVGWSGSRGGWGGKSGLQTSASVWG